MGSPSRERERSRRDDKHKKDRDRSRERDRDRDERRRRSRSRERRRSRSRDRRDKRSRSREDRERDSRKRSRRETSQPAADGAQQAQQAPDVAAAAAAAAAAAMSLQAARQAALQGHDAEEQRKREREAEQAKLDAEMEKRRKRIQAWQEQRRKEEEAAAAEAAGGGGNAEAAPPAKAKKWSLEDESSDDEEQQAGGEGGAADGAGGGGEAAAPAAAAAPAEEDEIDPLDAFMAAEVLPEARQLEEAAKAAEAAAAAEAQRKAEEAAAKAAAAEDGEVDPLDAFMQANVLPAVQQAGGAAAGAGARPGSAAGGAANGEASSKPARPRRKSRYDTDSSDEEADSSDEEKAEESEDEEEWMRKLIAGKLSKGDKLVAVDHAQIQYPPFRRSFYIEVPELARMGEEEVEEYRSQLDGVKVRGKNVPKPVKNWHQCGLSSRILDVLKKGGFERPLSIQAQALPVIMSGRDCIGIAKTGSGKTLAFVLPMLRHVKDQPPLAQGDGPVALCMAPTRELVTQIAKEVKRFAKSVGLTCVAVYGGSGVANQITELKRGTEIVVCTPGRMIDILVTSGGKITNLRRVTYLVLDEADRMFDMGFEPQIMRIVQNIRPDRQTVMFSATFPRQVEVLARQVLNNPVEIQVGGRSVVNKDIAQFIEIRPEEERFLRLLEVLGEWYERGKLIIFVSSQDRCDTLFRDLLRAGYPALSLHGGKDQSDRESTIADFKANVCNILTATSVAARGLDVKDLVLVVNYDVPNHHEDYVHRVGRTGRAGAKGTAITFIGPDEEQYAPDLVKALKESGAPVPQDLQDLADGFEKKRKEGKAQLHSSGFGGSGFKFDASEDNAVKAYKKSVQKQTLKAQGEEVESEDDDEDEIREVVGGDKLALPAPALGISDEQLAAMPPEVQARVRAAQALAAKMAAGPPPPAPAPAGVPLPGMPGAVPAAQLPAVIPASAFKVGQAGAAAPAIPGVIPASAFKPQQPAAPAAGAAPAGEVNPILAAAQAAARRLAEQAGMSAAAAAAPAAPAVPAVAPSALLQQMLPPGGVAPSTAGAASAVLQQMMGPGGMLPGAAPGVLPGAVPGAVSGAVPAAVPGAVPGAAPGVEQPAKHFETELVINDFPQHARWKVTHRETIRDMGDLGAAVVVKGKYYKPGTAPGPLDERKLYLHIEGPTPDVVKRAKQEIKRILEESTEKAMRREAPAAGRYSVM